MGYYAHHAVIIHVSGSSIDGPHTQSCIRFPDLDGFRKALPQEFQQLLIGPIPGAINGDYSVVFLPDGSKEGWETSDEGDRIRHRLVDLFNQFYEDLSTPFDVAEVRFGGDDWDLVHAGDPRRRDPHVFDPRAEAEENR